MKRLFSFGKRSSKPTRPPSVSDGVGGWAPVSAYPTPAELTAMMPGGLYRFDNQIGQGGMGAVYAGVQTQLGREVAIKILHRQHGTDYAYPQRFRREAQSLAQMNHPNIVSVYDFGLVGDYLFYVMEYVRGCDLHQLMAQGPMQQAQVIRIFDPICQALTYAHSKGIVHRDIKPANILLAQDGGVKVADFGLAKRFDSQATLLTQTNMAMGTPDYAAPEQYDTKAELDHRADLYALGVMLYQMLTGQLPRGAWHAPSELVGCDERLDGIIMRALKPDRTQRFESAEELRQHLLAVQGSEPQVPRARSGETATSAGVRPVSGRVTSPRTSGSNFGAGSRVLVLEDDLLLRNLIVRNLKGEGYEIVETADGHDTVRLYSEAMMTKKPFDIVLIDLTIPLGLGGAKTMQMLRQLDPQVDAIVSSGNRSDPAMLQPSAHGFADVLPKPYDSGDLIRVVRHTLVQRRARLARARV